MGMAIRVITYLSIRGRLGTDANVVIRADWKVQRYNLLNEKNKKKEMK